MIKQFLRRTARKISKLGKGRRNKQVWRRPTGRHNKMREKKRGYPAIVSIGYSTKKTEKDLLREKTPVLVYNIKDLSSIKKNEIAVIAKVGKKNKIELAKFALEKKISVHNLNPEKFLKGIEKQNNFLKKKSGTKKNTEPVKEEKKEDAKKTETSEENKK